MGVVRDSLWNIGALKPEGSRKARSHTEFVGVRKRSSCCITWEPLTAVDPGGTGEAQAGEIERVGQLPGQTRWLFEWRKLKRNERVQRRLGGRV